MALSRPIAARFGAPLPAAPRWRRYAVGYGLAAPALLLVLSIIAYPLAYELQLSLTDAQTSASSSAFVGLQNYAHVLSDLTFWMAVRNTAFLVVVTSAAELLVGLAVALLLWRRTLLGPLLFTLIFLPWVYPSSFASYTWYWMLLPPFHTFYTVDAIQARFWLESIFGEQAWQILSFMLVGVWRGSAIVAIMLLAGLRTIPRDLLEYARLEIANPIRYFWLTVLPLARRFFALASAVTITVAYLQYLAMYIESNGRITVPVLGTLVYRAELVDGRTGYAAALSLTQLPVAVVLVLVLVPLIESRVRRHKMREADSDWRRRLNRPVVRSGRPTRVEYGWPQTRFVGNALRSAACLVIAAFYLLPLYYTAVQSVKSQQDFIKGPLGQPFWPFRLDFQDGWLDTLHNPLFWRACVTTFVVFGSVVVIGSAVALLAAYGLARLRPPGAGWLSRLLFATYLIPQLALVVPLLHLYSAVGLESTLPGIVLVYLTLAIPFAIWLFYTYFQAIDSEAEEHALLDGSRLRVFFGVVLPRAWPVITAAAIFAIGMMASDLLYARVLTLSAATRTLPVTMGSLVYDPDIWADANAAILAGAIPLLIVSLALGRMYLRGLSAAFAEE